ncbi:MAG TPA: oligogalacturonate lyase family protein [Opitutaceae bacterium]|nr:oligogalacturonate lyase family protein [Opitutaceae bacterium]
MRTHPRFSVALLLLPFAGFAAPVTPPVIKNPPRSWIDPETGHRVIRITDEPDSESLYFNDNSITPDGKEMVITTAEGGIDVVDLATWANRQLVPGRVRVIMVGHRTNRVFYLKPEAGKSVLYATDLETAQTQKLAELPDRGGISAINADETLAAGTEVLDKVDTQRRYPTGNGKGYQADDKMEMMDKRLAAHLLNEIYTVDLRTGERKSLIRNRDWLNHLQFSPTDPTLLMYCHEGPWWKVDRIWTIRTDGSQNTLVQPRTMEMEASGHEFWSHDGKTIWYDHERPWGTVFFVSGYNVETQARISYHLERSEWSIHFNATDDDRLFCGDGSDNPPAPWADAANRWIYLFHPDDLINGAPWPSMHWDYGHPVVRAGLFHTDKLVHLVRHNYLLEPNPFFTPDRKYVIFRSDMFGDTYAFAVEVARTGPTGP